MSFGFSWVIILTHIKILRLKTIEKTMATSATSQSYSVLSTKIIIDMQGTIEWRITHPLSMRCKLQICVKIVTTTPSVMVHHHQLNTISMNGRLTNAPLFSFSYCYCGTVVNWGKINTNPNRFYLITIWLKCLTWPFHSIPWKNYHIELDPYCANFNCSHNNIVYWSCCYMHSSPLLSIVCTSSSGHCIKKEMMEKWRACTHRTLYLHLHTTCPVHGTPCPCPYVKWTILDET